MIGSVYCIVITYNGAKWIDKCLGSLRKSDYPLQVIVVDNGSGDGTQEKISRNYPEVDLIQSDENLGFGKANNVGMRVALNEGADYIILLNQDAYLLDHSLERLLEAFEQEPAAGIVSPLHLAGDGHNLDFGFRRYLEEKNTPALLVDMAKGKPKLLYKSRFVNAAAWIIKAPVIKAIGMFHPIFDHYVEDREYVHRLQSNGWGIYVYPHLRVVHDRYQGARTGDKNVKRSMLYKQQVLLNFCTRKYNHSHIDRIYIKVILLHLLLFNFKYASLSLKSWLDIRRKIKKYDLYRASMQWQQNEAQLTRVSRKK